MRIKKVFLLLFSAIILMFSVLVSAEEIATMMVTSLDASISSIEIPINGEWMETGEISVSLGNKKVSELNLEERRGLIVWPARLKAPLFSELGIDYLDAEFAGLVEFREDMMVSADFSRVDLYLPNEILNIIIKNDNGSDRIYNYPEPYYGRFIPDLTSTMDFKYEALNIANEYFGMNIGNPEEFLIVATELEEETGNELVLYYPEYNEYVTADLEGEFCIEFNIE